MVSPPSPDATPDLRERPRPGRVEQILGPMRLPFLLLTPACVLLGLATAVWSGGNIRPLPFVLALVGALCAHISVNAFNEYLDFRSGLDFRTRRTPFSGGSGTLPARPQAARAALITALLTLGFTSLIGLYFLRVWGLALLPLGLAGVLVILAYTPWATHSPLLCLVAPGLGFGTCMVLGTHFVLTGEYSWTGLLASCVPFFLVSDLLLLNQFPDVEADRSVGRRHLPIVLGRSRSSLVYGGLLLAAYLTMVVGVGLRLLPATALLGLLTLPLAVPAFLGARRHAENMEGLGPALGMNVGVTILTPVLVAVGVFVA